MSQNKMDRMTDKQTSVKKYLPATTPVDGNRNGSQSENEFRDC